MRLIFTGVICSLVSFVMKEYGASIICLAIGFCSQYIFDELQELNQNLKK